MASPPRFHNTVQVAGIASWEEARMLLDCGVDYLGFPFGLPIHNEDTSEREARDIIMRVGGARAVVITYLDDASAVGALVERLGTGTVQLHGDFATEELVVLRSTHPRIHIIKSIVIRPNDPPDIDRIIAAYDPLVDAYIADTFDPATGASGATGKTHDWAITRKIVDSTQRPVILAGGLRPENVARAIRAARPSAVDVHTGVEDAAGHKSKHLTQQFVTAARAAFESA